MSDEIEKKAEEIPVTRVVEDNLLTRQSSVFISSLTNRATLPDDAEQQLDEVSRRMRTFIRTNNALTRQQSKDVRETLSALMVKAQQDSIAAHTRHIQNLIVVGADVRKRQLMGLWMEFIQKEGARIIAGVNTFVSDWQKYSQAEIEKAENSQLTASRKERLKATIQKNEEDMLDDIQDMIVSFRKQNKEQEKKVEETLK